jgi:acetyl esterase/lipase
MMHFRLKRSAFSTHNLLAPTLACLLALGGCGGKASPGSGDVTADAPGPVDGPHGPGGGPHGRGGGPHGRGGGPHGRGGGPRRPRRAATPSLASAGAMGTSEIAPTHSDLAYANQSPSQRLDLYLPAGANGPSPLVIAVHGGAFMVGDKDMEADLVPALTARGYAVASLNYRLSSEAPFPAGARDVKAAVRWLRANASRYGLDPDKFAAWGRSAGGHLVAMLGTTGDQKTELDDDSLGNPDVSSAVQAVVDWFGPTDFLTMDSDATALGSCDGTFQQHNPAESPESKWLGGPVQSLPEKARSASPISYIATAKRLPPFLIAHGDTDCMVPYRQSAKLHEALTAARGTSTFNLLKGATHGDPQFIATQLTPAIALLDRTFGR